MIGIVLIVGKYALYALPLLLLLISNVAKAQTSVVQMTPIGQAYIAPIPALDSVSTKARKLFSQISSVSVSGYTINTDYSLKGAISGSDTIKANTPIGTTIIGFGAGNFTTATLNVGAITVKILLGGIVVLSNTFSSLPINISTQSPYQSKITMTVRSGSVAADGYIDFAPVNGLGSIKMPFPTTVTNVDWTTDKVFDVRVQYSNSGNSLTSINQNLLQY